MCCDVRRNADAIPVSNPCTGYYIYIAIDTVDGQGLSYEARRVLLPNKSKVMLYLPFITQ